MNPARLGQEDNRLWQFAKARGMSRRRFLQLMLLGGSAAVIAACSDVGDFSMMRPAANRSRTQAETPVASESLPFFKNTAPFILHEDKGLEARLESMQGVITPNKFFFVRNNSVSLDLDASDWRLSIEGDAVDSPIQLSYDDILNMPSRALVSYLECGGNHRAMFDMVKGRKAKGTQWTTGGVSNGEWVGVSLRDALTLVGITDDAVSVLLVGLDTESPEGGFRRVISAEKAMHPDTLLAYGLNGEPLPKDHGFPLRALVPGWVGSSSIKWLDRIEVSSQQLWTRNNTTSYVLIGEDYTPEGDALGEVITTQSIKSALALPLPAEVSAGLRRIRGYAHSPHGRIARVEWSDDSGISWSDANLIEPQIQYSWARFELEWDAQAGEHIIMTRATDTEGNTQPDDIPFNEKGYLFNQPLPHPIRVV